MEEQIQDSPQAPHPVERIKALLKRSLSVKAIIWVLVCTILGTAIGYYNAKKRPYRWTISALILAHVGREFGSARSEIIVAGGSSRVVSPPNKEHINTEVQLMQSPDLMRRTYESLRQDQDLIEMRERQKRERAEKTEGTGGGGGGFSISGLLSQGVNSLLRKLDLTYQADPNDTRFESWAGTLNVSTVARSNLIRVTCTVLDPELGKRFLERWITEYKDAHIAAYSQKGTAGLFKDEVERLQGELKKAEDKLTDLRLETGRFDVDMMRKSLLEQRMKAAGELHRLDAEMAAEKARFAELVAHLDGGELPEFALMSQARGRNPMRDQYERILLQLEENIAEIHTRVHDDEPTLRRELEKRDAILKLLSENPSLELVRDSSQTTGRDPVYSSLRQSKYQTLIGLSSLAAQKRRVEQNVDEINAQLAGIERGRWQHVELMDAITSARADLGQVREGERIGRMNATLDNARVTNIKVVSPPTMPPAPIKMMGLPHRVAMTGMGGIIGFGVSLGLYLFLVALREAGFLPQRRKKKKGELAEDVDDSEDPEVWMISGIEGEKDAEEGSEIDPTNDPR